jgi:SAM-dependent methyltransferase
MLSMSPEKRAPIGSYGADRSRRTLGAMAEQPVGPSAGYSLALSEQERSRYRMMAAGAALNEAAEWTAAGIAAGARVADIGCGPGAVLRLLAERVGRDGAAIGVDANADAVAMAIAEVSDLPQAKVRIGRAQDADLDPDSFDVVMCRHVLAHNGGRETAIVAHLASLAAIGGSVYLVDIDATALRLTTSDLAHLASLAAIGGSVYLVDIDATALRLTTSDPDLYELQDRYQSFQRGRGNDLSVGLRLGDLLTDAGLDVERYACRSPVLSLQPGMRPPSWAARNEMVAEGFATNDDIQRWEDAFVRLDKTQRRPWLFPAAFVAIGRRPN